MFQKVKQWFQHRPECITNDVSALMLVSTPMLLFVFAYLGALDTWGNPLVGTLESIGLFTALAACVGTSIWIIIRLKRAGYLQAIRDRSEKLRKEYEERKGK